MRLHRFAGLSFVSTLAGALTLAGCAGSATIQVGASSNALTAGSGGGSTTPQLVVTVSEVDVHLSDGATAPPSHGSAPSDLGWVTVFKGSQSLDLYDVAQTEAFLGQQTVPAGRVEEVRLVLANDAQLVTGAGTQSVTCPSCTETGLKIPTEGTVTVAAGQTLRLTLSFDAPGSLVQTSQGPILQPVVHLQAHTQ